MRELVNEKAVSKKRSKQPTCEIYTKTSRRFLLLKYKIRNGSINIPARVLLYEKAAQLPAVVNTALNTRIALKH